MRARLSGAAPRGGAGLPGLRLPTAQEKANFLWRRTGDRVEAWASCGASETVQGWLRDGYKLPWLSGPPAPFTKGASFESLTPDERSFLMPELQRFLLCGALEPGPCGDYVSRAFLRPKPGQPGKWRLLFDLRHVNEHLKELLCRYETLKSVRGMIEQGDYCFSLDMQDGYYCVPIHQADRKYLTFEVAGLGRLQFAALPMGLSASPYVFTKTMRVFVQALRSPMQVLQTYEAAQTRGGYLPPHRRRPGLRSLVAAHRTVMETGVRTLPYVDDFAFFMRTLELALQARSYVEALLDLLGLARNAKKGTWEPTQRLAHLGLGVDTLHMVYFLPEARRLRVESAAAGLLAEANGDSGLVGKRHLAGAAGLVASCALAMPLARHYLRSLYDVIATEPRWDGKVRLTRDARRSLAWLLRIPERYLSRPIEPLAATAEVWTDASPSGWGGVAHVDGAELEARGRWSAAERSLHINVLEMRAKELVTRAFGDALRRRHVLFRGDNMVATYVAASGTSRSPALMEATRGLYAALDELSITTTERWLSTTDNAHADRLSRESAPDEARLRQSLAAALLQRYGPHHCDRFASEGDALLPRWNSAHAHPLSSGVDAFAQTDWGDGLSWCHPPLTLLGRLAVHLRQTGAAATVVAPDWPAQMWYQQLRALATAVERVPGWQRPFEQPTAAARWGCIVFSIPAR